MKKISHDFDFVVVGGGMSGICTAIAAARKGVKTALVQDRSVLGGNASSEMRVHLNGGGRGGNFQNAIESGIILEIILANKNVNPQNSYHVFDKILWEKVNFQENLTLFLNTTVRSVKTADNKITEVTGHQLNTEIEFTFTAKYFADTTGDGTLAYLSGADYTIGHEARSTYNETLAPEEANEHVMGSSVLFSMMDMGKPTPFERPFWAHKYTKEMLGKRGIPELTHGYWWIELDGEISESQNIQDELNRYVYGVFDYIKNSGDYPESENLAIDWISSIAGKRESRRIYGDYVLNQNDIDNTARHPHAVGYGGWTMDDHTTGGITALGNPQDRGTIWHQVDDIYTIPYECIYSRNVNNLFIGGRCFSASHMAMSSARVMCTGAIMGQAAGTAAAIALRENIMPREVISHIYELQQTLIKDDCYIPGIVAKETDDLATNQDCKVTASSSTVLDLNGDYSRKVYDTEYGWISDGFAKDGEWVQIAMPKASDISKLILRFDPNFNRTNIITQSHRTKARQAEHMPPELVRDYTIVFLKDGKEVATKDVTNNFQRFNTITARSTSLQWTVLRLSKSSVRRVHVAHPFGIAFSPPALCTAGFFDGAGCFGGL